MICKTCKGRGKVVGYGAWGKTITRCSYCHGAGRIDPDAASDPVNHPAHYNGHPSGVECITITEHMGFNTGNAIKYIWRADLKNDALEDLQKAAWYINREIEKRKKAL